MADFYFFADYDLLDAQPSADAFDNDNLYSIHSLNIYHDLNGIEKFHPQTAVFFGKAQMPPPYGTDRIKSQKGSGAYAVCNGRIFVFKDSVGTKALKYTGENDFQQTVTIVLQPSNQPAAGLPKIKYFIYRGILLASLVDTFGKVIPDGRKGAASPFYNNLTTKILDADPSNLENAFANALDKNYGINSSNTFIKILDEVFFRDNETYQLFNVKGGESIGFFNQFQSEYPNNTKIKFGIIFDAVGYHPTIDQIWGGNNQSLLDNKINYNYNSFDFSNSNKQALSDYSYMGTENIKLNFLDPCAFYGSFAYNVHDKIYARKFTDVFDKIDRASPALPLRGKPVFTLQSFDDLYNNILKKFYNKNLIYIDIRNPENKSLDFYKNYHQDIKLLISNPTSTGPNSVFAVFSDIRANDPSNTGKTHLTLNPSFFGTGSQSSNDFQIALPDGKTTSFISGGKTYNFINNETPSVYIDSVYLNTDFPASLFGSSNFVPSFQRNLNNSGYSSPIKLRVQNYNNDLQQPVCTYIRISYIKESDPYILPEQNQCCDHTIPFPHPLLEPSPNADKTIRSYEYLDNFFTPFGMLLPQTDPGAAPKGIASNIYYDTKYLDNTKIGGKRLMAYPGIAQDSTGRVTLFAVPADIRSPRRRFIESGVSISGLVAKSNPDLFIEYLAKKYTSLNRKYKKILLDRADIGETTDRMVELIDFDRSLDTNALTTVSAETLVWLTIEGNDFKRLKEINNSRANASYLDTVSGSEFKADFIDPSKTYLGIIINSTGTAKDKNNGGSLVDYIKYELVLRNETYDSVNDSTPFKSVPTGIYVYSVRVEGPRIDEATSFPEVDDGARPFSVTPNPSGGSRLKSTIYLLPDANITKEELWEYLQYVQCNIRQVWTNRSDYNCGKYNVGFLFNDGNSPQIDAEQIVVKIGTAVQASRLEREEAAFRVRKPGPAVPNDRDFAIIRRNVGVLFYKPISGLENTPAHEFGHLMGLADRYTSTGVVDTSTFKFVGDLEGNKPMFMNDFSPFETGLAFDPEFIKNYDWAYNLYSTGKIITPTSAGMPPLGKLAIGKEKEFDDKRNNPAVAPINESSEIPSRYGRICSLITMKQWNIIQAFANSPTAPNEASSTIGDPRYNRLFSNSEYVFLKAYNSTTSPTTSVEVSFIGLFFEVGVGSKVAVSDLRYQYQNSSTDNGKMNLRIKKQPPNIPSYELPSVNDDVIVGYISPYVGALAFDRNAIENNNNVLFDIETSGFGRLENMINDTSISDKKAEIKKIIPDYDGSSTVIDLTVLDPYSNYGDANTIGRKVWNYMEGALITKKVGSFTIKYKKRPCRIAIIKRIQGVSYVI